MPLIRGIIISREDGTRTEYDLADRRVPEIEQSVAGNRTEIEKLRAEIAGLDIPAVRASGNVLTIETQRQKLICTCTDIRRHMLVTGTASRAFSIYPNDVSQKRSVAIKQDGSFGFLFDEGEICSYDNSLTDCFELYAGQTALKSVDMSAVDFSRTALTHAMFYGCSQLTAVNLGHPDFGNVWSTYQMFEGCGSLGAIDTSDWDLSKVQSSAYMFSGCTGLTSLDVGSWGLSSLTFAMCMFYGCSSLRTLDVSEWNLASIKTNGLAGIFMGCSSLSGVDVSKWDVSRCTDLSAMFQDCYSVRPTGYENWDVRNVTKMFALFRGCRAMTEISVRTWNAAKVTDMSAFADNCTGLVTLDLGGWDLSKVTTYSVMFRSCSRLKNIIGPITGIRENLDLSPCIALTAESAMTVIEGLATVTAYRNLRLPKKAYAALSDEQKAVATSKGWTLTSA